MAAFLFGNRLAISPSFVLLIFLSIVTIVELGCAAPVAADNTTLNLSGIECTRNSDWFGRMWKPDMKSYCLAALQRLEYDEVVGRVNQLHEFLPENVAPVFDIPVVRTPHKTTWGPCTIAVTTLESLQRKGLDPTPEIGLGPFPNSDRASWVTMANYGRGILSHCIDSRRPTAGVYAAGIMEGLGLFIYGTGSRMDFKVGLSVSGLSLPGFNATNGDGELAFGTSFL